MKRATFLLFLTISSYHIFGQITLIREDSVIHSTETGTWIGDNIPRSVPTIFVYRNNSITSINAGGYMLQAGDENPGIRNNNLDGEIITGNKFIWNGSDNTSITHAVFTGYNINAVLKYNYCKNTPLGLIRKSNGMTNTSGGVAYNIVIDPKSGVIVKGMNNVNVYNNTFYSSKTTAETWRGLIDIYTNTDFGLNAPSKGTKVFNNIFYTKHQIRNIYVYETEDLIGFESDYNVFWCEDGAPMFRVAGADKTFAQWQALGYDTHSVVINPNFKNFTDFVPGERLNYGKNLGLTWQTGLSVDAVWGKTDPANTNQNGTWQVGARVYRDYIPVSTITVSGAGGATSITTNKGTIQLSAVVLPANATNAFVTWSLVNGTGQATISATGLVTAMNNGTVTARATANDGSGIFGTLVLTISNQIIPVTIITVSGAGGATSITTNKGTIQLSAVVLPANATNASVTWSLVNGTGQATISATGLVTAINNGTVTARATANDGSGILGTLVLTISNQIIPVTIITVSGAGGATSITINKGTIQLSAVVLPANATNASVTWSIVNGTGQASIDAAGLVTAMDNGTVTARATANDGSGILGTLVLTISNQIIPVTIITVSGAGGATSITIDKGTLQLSAVVLPANATNASVTWYLVNGTGQASIDAAGLVTAIDNGTVFALATANDNSGIFGTLELTISNQLTFSADISDSEKKDDSLPIIVTRSELIIVLDYSFFSCKAELYNLLGVLISGKQIESGSIIFDISRLPSGIYFVVLSKGFNKKVVKVLKP